MEDRITVAQVLELGVAVTWQQAVAITLEAWHVAVNAEIRERPAHLAPESCVLTVSGDVLLPRPAVTAAPDAAQQLLRALLDGVDAPSELVEIAFSTRTRPLSDDLAPFSRPNRRVEIVDVATRAVTALAALGGLPGKARPLPETPAAVPDPVSPTVAPPSGDAFDALRQQASARPPAPPPPRATRRPVRWVPVVAGTAVAVGAVLAWRFWPVVAPRPSAATESNAPVDAIPLEASPPDPAWSAAGRREADISLPRRSPGTPAPGGSPTAAKAAADVATADTGAKPVAADVPEVASAPPVPSGAGGPDAAPPFESSGTIYSATSDGVTPPTMIFPRMPRAAFPEPGDALDDRPYLEVLVNERGDVDAVRLRGNLTTSDTVRHGMMLAPAKAWHFTPATRDGRPVRYVVRVLVDR